MPDIQSLIERESAGQERFTRDDVAAMLADTHWEDCAACAGTGAREPDGKTCATCNGEGVVWVRSDEQ